MPDRSTRYTDTDDLIWSAERRLRFIEKQLYWEGILNRRNLKNAFRVSDQQASADIAAYDKRAPGNSTYDRTEKAYLATDDFQPLFGPPDPHVDLLRSGANFVETLPFPKRSVDIATVRDVYRAIRRGHALDIRYQSLSRPRPTNRWITPHALAFDSHRWHARAFCHTHGDFRDFVLGRVLSIRNREPHPVDPALDLAWTEYLDLVVGTHPALPKEQQRAVELDYKMRRGRLRIPVRAALATYLMRWMRLDLDPNAARPEQIQIVLLNPDEVHDRRMHLNHAVADRIVALGIPRFGSQA